MTSLPAPRPRVALPDIAPVTWEHPADRAALQALRPGGRLVVNAITLEKVAEAYAALKAEGAEPEVTLVQISRSVPLAHYQRYEALNPIHIIAADKPSAREARS